MAKFALHMWEHLEDDPQDLAAGLDGVGGVHKEQITGGQVQKGVEGDFLGHLREQADAPGLLLALEHVGWVGLDAGDRGCVADLVLNGLEDDAGGNAAADLDNLRKRYTRELDRERAAERTRVAAAGG